MSSKIPTIKPLMPAPQRRNMVVVAMAKRKAKGGAHGGQRRQTKNDWRNEVWE
jgi:hypothetical protein